MDSQSVSATSRGHGFVKPILDVSAEDDMMHKSGTSTHEGSERKARIHTSAPSRQDLAL